MAQLLNGASSGASSAEQRTGPCTLVLEDDSEMDGARVIVEAKNRGAADAKYAQAGLNAVMRGPGMITLDVVGDYDLRARIAGEGPSTSINLVSLETA